MRIKTDAIDVTVPDGCILKAVPGEGIHIVSAWRKDQVLATFPLGSVFKVTPEEPTYEMAEAMTKRIAHRVGTGHGDAPVMVRLKKALRRFNATTQSWGG